MKRENNKKFKKRKRNQNRSLTCRVLSMMFAIVLFCSTVLINTDYVSQASSFDDMVDMVEVEEDSAAVDISEETGDDLGTDVNFESEESTDETYSESDDLGSSDADFSSGENMFTDGTSESSAPAEEAAQPVSCIVNLKNETIEIKAEAPAGVLPNGTQMIVKAVENNTEDAELTDQYNKLAAKITEQLQSQGKNLDGFLAYNVSFTDADGNPVEPAGKVNYSFTYKEASSPELTDPAASTVTAAMIRTNKETSELEVTELKAEEDQLTVETNESRQLIKAAFQSAGTDTYTFVWSSTPAADDNENNENKEQNGEVNNEEVNADTNTENTEENGEETNTENNVENSEEEQNPEEAPDQEQIKMIRITADEVNLRVSPSTEADVIATVDTDTQLPLLETVTDEDEFTWYKVSYEEAEAYVRSDMAEVVENEEQDVKVEEQAPAEITRYDYESDEVNVKVTLTNPEDLPDEAELSVTPVEISQEAEEQINQDAIEQQKAIENLRAYDIKFLLDGEEIQPGATVKVEVSFPNEDAAEDADVYHVDKDENVENMNGSVNEEGNVEFDTTHFSTYVIVNNSLRDKVKVTLQHYDEETKKPIYAETVKEINVGGEIPDYRAIENYTVSRVVKIENGNEIGINATDKIVSDTTIRIYYNASSTEVVGDMTLYDYQINPGNGSTSINADSNYPEGSLWSKRMAMGNRNVHTWPVSQYTAIGSNGQDANLYIEGQGATTGLVKGLSEDFKDVLWNVDQPGFFTDKNLGKDKGKQKYTNYKLNFEKKGNNYKLKEVLQPNGGKVNAGKDFYPLDSNRIYDNDGKGGSYYFGIRYDVEFQLGDYIGPLEYKFTGDDDLWVLLDGKKVVIDVGGIHEACDGKTDLWEDLGYINGARPGPNDIEAKNATHRITVLYMERGAGNSNCQMEFTIPNATISQVTTDAIGKLSFTKVDKQGTGLPGATFGLYADENCTQQIATSISGDNGITNFEKLRPGEYYLKELQAPAGYAISSTKWKVEVITDIEDAVVENMQGEEIKDKKFVNEKYNEVIQSSMETSKTAKVKNWDDRTYDITITAASTSTSTTTSSYKPVVDIMLALNVSGSMDDELKSYTYKYIGDNSEATRNELSTSATNNYIEVNGSYKKLYYRNGRWYVKNGYEAANKIYAGCKIYTRITTRLEALKASVNQFIEDTAANSPSSNVGITVFSRAGKTNNGKTTELLAVGNSNNKDTLKKFVDDLYADGGTEPAIGLENARIKLDALGGDNPKYVVLFTDGEPTGAGSEWNTTAQQKAETQARYLREGTRLNRYNQEEKTKPGYTVYTIGFDLKEKAQKFLAGDPNNSTKYPGIASPGCAKTANDAASLGAIFQEIQNTITQDIDIHDAIITDVIDPRFELVDANGNVIKLEKNGTLNLSEGVVVTRLENGNYQIQWTGQTIPNKKNGNWSKTITVKAKDEYIGGNNVTTNVSPDSKITTGYGEVVLNQPTVNVKVKLQSVDKEITIYKGDEEVPTVTDVRNEMFNATGTTSYTNGTISADDAENQITYKWYKKDESGNRVEIKEKDLTKVVETAPDDNTEYYLEVTYKPTEVSNDVSKANTNQCQVEDVVLNSTYKINVIKGQIQIKKTVTEKNEKDARDFIFNVKDSTGKDVSGSPVTVTVKAGQTSGTATIPDLARGSYTVTEKVGNGYTIQKFEIVTGEGQTDCESSQSNDETKSMTFVLGKDTVGNNVIKNYTYTSTDGGVKGVASYTNEVVTDLDLKKTNSEGNSLSGAIFELKKWEENDWESVSDNIEVDNTEGNKELTSLLAGRYMLTETKAPDGYSKLGSSIYFKVENGTVTLTDKDGNPTGEDFELWQLDTRSTTPVLTIKNQKLYSLPESGGNGIYWYMIGGMVLMSAAAWILYKNKCREVLGK